MTFLAGHGQNLPPTWLIHMVARRPAHNTPIHMDFLYGFLLYSNFCVNVEPISVKRPIVVLFGSLFVLQAFQLFGVLELKSTICPFRPQNGLSTQRSEGSYF